MLRLAVWLLLLANAGYFAWTQGYLKALGLAPAEQREPERLQAQLRPETLRLLNSPRPATPPAPATTSDPANDQQPDTPDQDRPEPSAAAEPAPATPAPTTDNTPPPPVREAPETRQACWQASGFTPAQGDALRAALALLDLPRERWQLQEVRTGGRWVVYMGRFNDEQLARKKAELRELNVDFREVSVPALSPGLALGTYSSEAAAQQALQDVGKKGVRTARVAQERTEGSSFTLRLPAATDAQRDAVARLGAPLAGKRLQRCE